MVERLNSKQSTTTTEAERYKCSRTTITNVRKEFMGDNWYSIRGDGFTKDDAELILELSKLGLSHEEIAEKFDDGLKPKSTSSIAHIIYKHRPRTEYPKELVKTSLRKMECKESELGHDTRYLINHIRGIPQVVLSLDDYLQLKSNTPTE